MDKLQMSFLDEIEIQSEQENIIEKFLVSQFSAGDFADETERQRLEQLYSKQLCVTDKFSRQSVSYQLSKKDALHSWLKYKEGFSANLVSILLEEMGAKHGDLVMDPFMGSGTTALVCRMKGIDSVGFDIMPISAVSIKAKSNVMNYDLEELDRLICNIESLNVPSDYNKRTPYITITDTAYPDYTERFLQYITDWNEASEYSPELKNLLTLCIINSLERISYTTKSGQYLSWDSRSKKVISANKQRAETGRKLLPLHHVREVIPDAKDTILSELYHVRRDIELIQAQSEDTNTANINFIENSVLYELPKMQNDILKGVITSPPYCNRYDYTRTYALELVYLGLGEDEVRKMRQALLSCTVESKSKMEQLQEYYESIGCIERFNYIRNTIQENKAFSEIMDALHKRSANGELNNKGVVRMVEGYFTELAFIYAELFRVCKNGSLVAFVNDNVRYGGEVIPVDFLSCSFAEQFGFTVKTIYTLKQQKGNSSQQMAKYGRVALRKSITVWEKK